MDEELGWRERERQVVARCGIFDLVRTERAAGDGRRGVFHILEAPDWVNVVPVLPGERFLMVRQYRQGIRRVTVEFPAGLAEPGEDPAQAAARELEEETGRRASTLRAIGRIAASPAFMDNWCSTYCAEGLARTGPPRPDELEHLQVVEVSGAELTERIGTGEFINPMTVVAWSWYLRSRGADRIRTGA